MTAEQPKYAIHQGDDYLEITGPTRMVLVARYPDNEDRDEAEKMVKQLTAAPDLLTALEGMVACVTPLRKEAAYAAIAKAQGK